MEYWYFRFVKHFFNDPKIIKMESEPGGYEYLAILLKMYCLSIDNGGTYVVEAKDVDDMFVLAKVIRHDAHMVSRALRYFAENGFLAFSSEPGEHGEEFLEMNFPYVKNMTGRSTARADRVRMQRHEAAKALPEAKETPGPQERGELEAFGLFDNVMLSQTEYDKFCREFVNAEDMIKRLSMYKRRKQVEYADDYATLLSWAEKDGIKVSKDKKTAAYYKHLHERAIAAAEDRKRIVTNAVPELSKIENELRMLYVEIAKSFGDPQAQKDLNAKIKMLTEQKEEILADAGYIAAELAPQFLCPICEDTGQRADGSRCSCWKDREREAARWKGE